ncbi:hypothetical protein DJ93_555 [Bacillus clarus]|uniref:Uncharacterized protein n=1 Tax=Bacillus clarus TaxID=2338372 RepID=A0A090YZH7_9BACI|nr:hypothetical protein DJ93_555 [Bacillus clarus]
MKENKKQEIQYIRVYTLRDRSTKSIKVESWRTFKDEMRVLGLKESDIFQIQLITKKNP